ncbi:MAG: hypothetical protein JWN78_1312, partial [Bacteroidota bacterium]|nr:hypothetical protein [Bacteroidota bacterium]
MSRSSYKESTIFIGNCFMKNFLFLLIISLTIFSCKKEAPASKTSSIPWDIVVKQKDSSGTYQVLLKMNLFPDSIFYDSIQYETKDSLFTLIPDDSLFSSDKIINTGFEYPGSTRIHAIKFDDQDRYLHFFPYYSLPDKEQLSTTTSIDFNYNSDGTIYSIGYGRISGTYGCGAGGSGAFMNYLTASNGNDSLLIDVGTLSCYTPVDVTHDTLYVSYTNKHNNVNAFAFSYPTFILQFYQVLYGFEYMPFKGLNANLIDHIDGTMNNGVTKVNLKYNYTFDPNGRVMSAAMELLLSTPALGQQT